MIVVRNGWVTLWPPISLPSRARVVIWSGVIRNGSSGLDVSPPVGMYCVVLKPLAFSSGRALSQKPFEPSSNVRLIIGLLNPAGAAPRSASSRRSASQPLRAMKCTNCARIAPAGIVKPVLYCVHSDAGGNAGEQVRPVAVR